MNNFAGSRFAGSRFAGSRIAEEKIAQGISFVITWKNRGDSMEATWLQWYEGLQKPGWTPEPVTIGLIWQVLYPLIAFSCIFVFLKACRGNLPWRVALPFAINLVANLAFTPIQFGLRNLLLASFDISIVLVTIVWGMIVIWRYQRWVAVLQVPYLAWVAIATVLQFMITWLNVIAPSML